MHRDLCRTGTGDRCFRAQPVLWYWLHLARWGPFPHWGLLSAVPMFQWFFGHVLKCFETFCCKKVHKHSATSLPRTWMSTVQPLLEPVPWACPAWVVAPARGLETPSLWHFVALGDDPGSWGSTRHPARALWSAGSDADISRESKHLPALFLAAGRIFLHELASAVRGSGHWFPSWVLHLSTCPLYIL